MTTWRKLALTLLAAAIATPVALVLWPSQAVAPRVVVSNFMPVPCSQESLPLDTPPANNAHADSSPPNGEQARVPPDTELTVRILDDSTGSPLPEVSGRFGLIDWRRDDETALYDVPGKDDQYLHTFTSDENGWVTLPVHVDKDSLRDGHSPIYPLPHGWVPATPAHELLAAVEAHFEGDTAVPMKVRLRRAHKLSVSCVDETGAPVEDVSVRIIPDMAAAFTHAMFPFTVDESDLDGLLERSSEAMPSPAQEGSGGTADSWYEFQGDGSAIETPELPREWEGIAGKEGLVRLTDIPSGQCLLIATRPGNAAYVEEFELSANTTRKLTFTRTADLTLHVRWHGKPPTYGIESVVGMGGELDIAFRGESAMVVELLQLRPGRYDLNLLDSERPSPAIFLKPGHNVSTLHIGPDAHSKWYVDLQVNGQKLEGFDIEMRHVDSPRVDSPWGTLPARGNMISGLARFEAGKPAQVRPGRYVVKLPDGEIKEMTFAPGQDVASRFDLRVREVTFSITREFADWVGRENGSGVSIESSSYIGAYTFDCLREALTEYEVGYYEKLEALAPGHPVTLGLPPAVYGLTLSTQWTNIIYQNEIDLTDPELTEVEFSMNGWPGVSGYHFHLDEVSMWVADDSIWLLEYSWYDDKRDVYTCFLPTKSFAGHFTVGETQNRRRCWVAEPGTYRPKPGWGYGECSVSIPVDTEDPHYSGWISWERGGVRFFCDLKEQTPATEIPAGPVKICLESADWPDGAERRITKVATFELELTGDYIIDPAALDWRDGGKIRLLCQKDVDNDSEYYSGSSWSAWEFDRTDKGDYLELRSDLLPDDEYYDIVIIAGRPVETRAVRVERGNDVVIDLRD